MAKYLFEPDDYANPEVFRVNWKARLWQSTKRIALALFGAAVIEPMHLMVLHKSQVITLTTVSTSTCLFAIFVALFSKTKEQEVMTITAAYAADLAIFVGMTGT